MIENKNYLELCIENRCNQKYDSAMKFYQLAKNEIENILNPEKLEYEMTILHYYCFPNQKIEGSKFLINYFNSFSLYENNVWSNLKFYVENLKNHDKVKIKNLACLDLKRQDFINSSPCKLIMKNGKEHLNIRYVNYHYPDKNKQNIFLINGRQWVKDNTVQTKNLYNGEIEFKTNDQQFFKQSSDNISWPYVEGLEDIRLFEKNNKVKFLANSRDYNISNKIEFVTGEFDLDKNEIIVERIFNSPDNDRVEKNWTMLNEDEIIYKWSPIRIYDYENLQLQRTYNTPKIFKYFRGSAAHAIQIGEFKYMLVHTVHYEEPRKYLHWIVKLNQEGCPLAYSIPFDFEGEKIEYCLSMNYLSNDNLEFHYSTWDSSSKSLEIPFEYFNDKFIEV